MLSQKGRNKYATVAKHRTSAEYFLTDYSQSSTCKLALPFVAYSFLQVIFPNQLAVTTLSRCLGQGPEMRFLAQIRIAGLLLLPSKQ